MNLTPAATRRTMKGHATVQASFLQTYLSAFHRIDGWFQYAAALLFMAYNQFTLEHGVVAGDVLEIGAYHGLSTIAVATLRGAGKRLVVIDPFDSVKDDNVSPYGFGIRAHFDRNVAGFYPDRGFLHVIGRPSSEVTAADLGSGFSFCHIDGGHSHRETYEDLRLCYEVLSDGGLIALDDYFNPEHPGVCEGAVDFSLRHPGWLRPLAVAYNKILFQKGRETTNINAKFLAAFSGIEHKCITMWERPAILFSAPLREYLDLHASTPERFVSLGATGPRAVLRPIVPTLRAGPGNKVALDVQIENVSSEPLPSGQGVFGLSYHLLADSGEVVSYDNERAWIPETLHPGDSRLVRMTVAAPAHPGRYTVQLD